VPATVPYEDEDVVAVSKPPGEPVIAARGEPREACLLRRLEAERRERLFVVHRIDRDASGLVLFARNATAHRALSLAFEQRGVDKTYLAFAAGTLEPPRGRLEMALHAARRGKARPALPREPGRREAVTDYAVQRRWRHADETVSLIEARPRTGRHHQVRVHLRAAGTPILFDPLYGRGALTGSLEGAPCRRLALHALRLEVPSPGGGGRLALEAPLAEDLRRLEAWLDGGWERVDAE